MKTLQTPACQRQFRLVDNQGAPHPVLDDLYESLDAAWGEALDWCRATRDPNPDRWRSAWK